MMPQRVLQAWSELKTLHITTSNFDLYLVIVHEFFITHVFNFSRILFPTGQHETHAKCSACILSIHFLVLQPAVSAEFIIQLLGYPPLNFLAV